jgi:hypothetical protein
MGRLDNLPKQAEAAYMDLPKEDKRLLHDADFLNWNITFRRLCLLVEAENNTPGNPSPDGGEKPASKPESA